MGTLRKNIKDEQAFEIDLDDKSGNESESSHEDQVFPFDSPDTVKIKSLEKEVELTRGEPAEQVFEKLYSDLIKARFKKNNFTNHFFKMHQMSFERGHEVHQSEIDDHFIHPFKNERFEHRVFTIVKKHLVVLEID